LLQVESTNEGLPSDNKVLFGDFKPIIRLSEICRKRWCPGEGWAHLDWVEFVGREGVWEGEGSEIGVQKEELEGTVGESFGSDESMVPDDTMELCAFESPLPATVISE
jgi:hypothetical protein